MLLGLIILLFFAAGVLIAAYSNRSNKRYLKTSEPVRRVGGEGLRPLFAPDEDELRDAERMASADAKLRESEQSLRDRQKTLANLAEFRQAWLDSPEIASAAELLRLASETGSGKAYLETAIAVVNEWRAGKVSGLAGRELSQLLDRHYRLLPAEDTTPGISFRLRREIEDLLDPENAA